MVLADFSFWDFFWDLLLLMAWVIWFWLLITVFADLFRRHDTSGWAKVGWVVFVILLPYLGVLVYLLVEHGGMADAARRCRATRAGRQHRGDDERGADVLLRRAGAGRRDAVGARPDVEALARAHAGELYGVDSSRWELLRADVIERALPEHPAGQPLRQRVELGDGLFVAGDHRDTPSIQGALVSGRRVADAVAVSLGLPARL